MKVTYEIEVGTAEDTMHIVSKALAILKNYMGDKEDKHLQLQNTTVRNPRHIEVVSFNVS